MFGVDKTGRDVLAPQFSKGSRRAASEAMPNRDPEFDMAILSTKGSLEKNTRLLYDLRKQAHEHLSRTLARHPQESEIRTYIDTEIDRMAVERVTRYQNEAAEMASRAAILRNR